MPCHIGVNIACRVACYGEGYFFRIRVITAVVADDIDKRVFADVVFRRLVTVFSRFGVYERKRAVLGIGNDLKGDAISERASIVSSRGVSGSGRW